MASATDCPVRRMGLTIPDKQLLGINIFTYILGALIIFFLSMKVLLGPGWLGQLLGLGDVGTFTRVSDQLPLNVALQKT